MPEDGWWRSLPNGKRVSALGFGCSSLWAKASFDEARAQDVLEVARDSGINHFDTAPSYGAGCGERRLGAFLRRYGADAHVVSTKIGTNLVDGRVVRGFDRALVEKSFLGSLERLGVERVDALYLHGPSRDELTDGLFRWLEDQKRAGRVAFTGMESGDPAMFDGMTSSPLDVAMVHYNVADPSTGPMIERLRAAGKVIVSGTVLAQGKFSLQTFLPTDRNKLWYLLRQLKNDPKLWLNGPRLARRLARVDRSPHAVAIGFVTGNAAITSGLFGSTDPAHVRANAEAGRSPLDAVTRRLLGADAAMTGVSGRS